MATSSIFHNVVIDDPKKANNFVSAIEASIADPYDNSTVINANISPDKEDIRKLHNLRRNKTQVAQ